MTKLVRKATVQDYDAVMSITADTVIYGGYDYLPSEFHGIMTRHGGFILEIEGRVVGFLGYIITEGGRSFTPVGGRIHGDFQNRGLFKFLMDEVAKELIKMHPILVSRRMSIGGKNPHTNRILLSQRVVFRADYFNCVPVHSFLSSFTSNPESPNVAELSVEDLRSIARSRKQVWQHLFPTEYFLHDWHVYSFNEADVGSVFAEHANFHCIASYEGMDDNVEGIGNFDVASLSKPSFWMAMISTNRFGDSADRKLDMDLYGHYDESNFRLRLGAVLKYAETKEISFKAMMVVLPEGGGEVCRATLAEAKEIFDGKTIGLEMSLVGMDGFHQ